MSNYDSIFKAALEAYKRQTKNDLTSHPLLSRLQSCHSPHAVLAALREQILIPSESLAQSQSGDGDGDGDDRFSRWLVPTVNVLYAFSVTLAAEGAGVVNLEVCFFGCFGDLTILMFGCFFFFSFAGILTGEGHLCGHRRSPLGRYLESFCSDHRDAQVYFFPGG